MNGFVNPDQAGYLHSIELVTMVVLGGLGSVVGSIVGAAVLIMLPQVLTVFQEYENLLLGFIIIVSMIFMRDGIVPMMSKSIIGRRA
jgi:branched-chain amino acid transport system permease protein